MTIPFFYGLHARLTQPNAFFLWSYIKDRVDVPSLPRDLTQVKRRIKHAVVAISSDMLQ